MQRHPDAQEAFAEAVAIHRRFATTARAKSAQESRTVSNFGPFRRFAARGKDASYIHELHWGTAVHLKHALGHSPELSSLATTHTHVRSPSPRALRVRTVVMNSELPQKRSRGSATSDMTYEHISFLYIYVTVVIERSKLAVHDLVELKLRGHAE